MEMLALIWTPEKSKNTTQSMPKPGEGHAPQEDLEIQPFFVPNLAGLARTCFFSFLWPCSHNTFSTRWNSGILWWPSV